MSKWQNCKGCDAGSYTICRVCKCCPACCPSLPAGECKRPRKRTNPPKSVADAAIAAVKAAGDNVIRDLRTLALYEIPAAPELPLPYDLEAEAAVLEALIEGRATPAELGVTATDFRYPAYEAIVSVIEAMAETTQPLTGLQDHQRLISVLEKSGIDPVRMAELLQHIADEVPMRADVRHLARRVADLRLRRKTLILMRKIDNLWRLEQEPEPHMLDQLIARLTDERSILGIHSCIAASDSRRQTMIGIDTGDELDGYRTVTVHVPRAMTIDRIIGSASTWAALEEVELILNGKSCIVVAEGKCVIVFEDTYKVGKDDDLKVGIATRHPARIFLTLAGTNLPEKQQGETDAEAVQN